MKNTSSYPTISVVIATYNSDRTIERCLRSIRSQEYPQHNIEIILADGGSSDRTKTIAKKYNARVIEIDPRLQNAEYNKSIGIQKARHEILAMIDHDNVLPYPLWFKSMLEPFLEHKDVVGVETLRYHYDPHTSVLDRYFALFGAGDPLVWYLGKTDRLSYMFDTYNLAGVAQDRGNYYLVQFNSDNIPTIGANGFLVRRQLLLDYAHTSPGKYFDMDVNVDLIKKGFNKYAFVKNSILHLTGYGSVWCFLQRRMLFMTQYHLSTEGIRRQNIRRYGILNWKEKLHLIWIIILSITFVIPFFDSLRGWRRIRDSAWFLHPFLCFSFVVLYGWVIIKHQITIYTKRLGDNLCWRKS